MCRVVPPRRGGGGEAHTSVSPFSSFQTSDVSASADVVARVSSVSRTIHAIDGRANDDVDDDNSSALSSIASADTNDLLSDNFMTALAAARRATVCASSRGGGSASVSRQAHTPVPSELSEGPLTNAAPPLVKHSAAASFLRDSNAAAAQAATEHQEDDDAQSVDSDESIARIFARHALPRSSTLRKRAQVHLAGLSRAATLMVSPPATEIVLPTPAPALAPAPHPASLAALQGEWRSAQRPSPVNFSPSFSSPLPRARQHDGIAIDDDLSSPAPSSALVSGSLRDDDGVGARSMSSVFSSPAADLATLPRTRLDFSTSSPFSAPPPSTTAASVRVGDAARTPPPKFAAQLLRAESSDEPTSLVRGSDGSGVGAFDAASTQFRMSIDVSSAAAALLRRRQQQTRAVPPAPSSSSSAPTATAFPSPFSQSSHDAETADDAAAVQAFSKTFSHMSGSAGVIGRGGEAVASGRGGGAGAAAAAAASSPWGAPTQHTTQSAAGSARGRLRWVGISANSPLPQSLADLLADVLATPTPAMEGGASSQFRNADDAPVRDLASAFTDPALDDEPVPRPSPFTRRK